MTEIYILKANKIFLGLFSSLDEIKKITTIIFKINPIKFHVTKTIINTGFILETFELHPMESNMIELNIMKSNTMESNTMESHPMESHPMELNKESSFNVPKHLRFQYNKLCEKYQQFNEGMECYLRLKNDIENKIINEIPLLFKEQYKMFEKMDLLKIEEKDKFNYYYENFLNIPINIENSSYDKIFENNNFYHQNNINNIEQTEEEREDDESEDDESEESEESEEEEERLKKV